MKRSLLAMALLLTSVFSVAGCGSDDGEAPVESRIKNYSNESYFIDPLCERSYYSESLVCARGSNGAGEGAEFEELEELEDFMKFDDIKVPTYNYVDEDIDDDLLLPGDSDSTWAQVNPGEKGQIEDKNLLNAGHHIGVDTTGSSLRDANRQIRSEPPNPQHDVSPWLDSSIGPDLLRRPLDPLDAD